jgi:hypothetical protein
MPWVFSPSLQAIDQQVGYHGTPPLDTHCIGACTEESLDPEEFLYILEEHYHIPTGFVQLRDGVSCPRHLIGQQIKRLIVDRVLNN